jgi:hypothetical protein
MKILTLSVCSVLLFQGLHAEAEVESVRQATIPSKKVIHKKPVAEVKSVDAAKVPPPPPVANRQKTAEYVDPFSGGTGGFASQQKSRRAEVSIDDGVAAGSTDDILTRILSGTGSAKKGSPPPGDYGKTIRQMTEEITKNLAKEGGGLEKMLEHPSVRQATEAISKVLTAPADGSDKKKSLRQMTEEVMKNIDVGEVMKGIDVGEVMKGIDPELLKSISPELMKHLSPEMLKGFNPEMLKGISPDVMKSFANPEVLKGLNLDGLLKDLPKGSQQQKKGGKAQPRADYAASLMDSILGKGVNNGHAGTKKAQEPAYRKPANGANGSSKGKGQNMGGKFFDDSYDSTDDDWLDFFGKDDF